MSTFIYKLSDDDKQTISALRDEVKFIKEQYEKLHNDFDIFWQSFFIMQSAMADLKKQIPTSDDMIKEIVDKINALQLRKS